MDKTASEVNDPDWRHHSPRAGELERDNTSIVSGSDEYQTEETEQLRAGIEDTRAEMTQTINEIQERLSPENIMEQVKESVRDATIGKVERIMQNVGEKVSNATEPAVEAMGRAGTAIKETGTSVAETVRQNPIPAALIGLGVGMLVVNKFRSKSDGRRGQQRAYDRSGQQRAYTSGHPSHYAYSTELEGDSESAAGSLERVKNTATDVANQTSERITHLGQQAKEKAVQAGDQFGRLVRENPLAVGAVAIAVGAAVGLAIPTTNMEKEYVGETSKKLVDKAQQVARDAMDKVQDAVQEAGGTTEQKPKAKSINA